jgi:EAL domain-containing protein (putative c-di-GMP-specific phosphodiesterase class I)
MTGDGSLGEHARFDDASPGTTGPGRCLVVEDDDAVRRVAARMITMLGFEVVEAVNGLEALHHLTLRPFDVVVTDISMPGMDGMRLLREVRARDTHVQVILMTGAPTVETAISAIDYGVFKYLEKPLDLVSFEDAVRRAVSLSRMARVESRAALLSGNAQSQAADTAGLQVIFDRTLRSIWIAYHPIVSASTGELVGYEALVRSQEPGFTHPTNLLDAAERLGRLTDIGRLIRESASEPFEGQAVGPLLFVNLHPADLLDPALGAEGTRLRSLARRVVLEITERASLHTVPEAAARVAALRKMGFRIAVDDLGAGYAGLSSFAHLEPDFVKLDMSLVRGIDENHTKRRVVEAMTRLARDLHMSVVAEGIETIGEGEVLRGLGCDLLQGFLYASPGPAFPDVSWPHERSLG